VLEQRRLRSSADSAHPQSASIASLVARERGCFSAKLLCQIGHAGHALSNGQSGPITNARPSVKWACTNLTRVS